MIAQAKTTQERSPAPRQRPVRIALLGCGTVGSEVARRLLEHGPSGVELVGVLVRDVERERDVPRRLLTNDAEDLFRRSPELVIELIGGVDAAEALVRRALERAIPVVTANKSLIARRGAELERLAACTGASLRYEASVCAGVPVLGSLSRLGGDRVLRIQGIVNGTCNAILSRMEAGFSFDAALAEAQERGYAEADPSADVSGRDSAEKLCILAAAAGIVPLGSLHPDEVDCRGIGGITAADVAEARASRRSIRLVAEIDGATGAARVGPMLLAREHPLAGVGGVRNCIVVETELAGELVFAGPGAGPRETASAVLSDVARLLGRPLRPGCARAAASRPARHYVRVEGGPVDAGPVLETLRRHEALPSEVSLSRSRASAVVSLDEPRSRACAAQLAAAREGVLVMPLVG